VALARKRFGTVLVAVGVVLLLMVLFVVPAWAQAAAELAVDKTDNPDPITEGEVLTYNIDVTNIGDDPARAVELTDDLPAGTAFVSASTTAGTCTTPDVGDNGIVTCELGRIAAGESVAVTIEVRPRQTGIIINEATARGRNTDEAVDSTRTRVLPDLVINKLDDPDPVSGPEQLLLYTLRVQNQGNSTVFDIGVTDDLPLSQVDFVALDSRDFDCIITAGAVQCTGGILGPGEIAKVEIVVEPEVAGTIQNTAAVFFQRTLIDTDTEETVVQESAVTDEPDDDTDGDGTTDGGTDDGTDGNGTTGEQGDLTSPQGVDDGTVPSASETPDTGGLPVFSGAVSALALFCVMSLVVRFRALRR
jgi:uncharacterized repeat protein (TIGR01451 family)